MKISSARFHTLAIPLRAPLRTARWTLHHRDVLIVELQAEDGTCGYGESPAFSTDWYLPETLGEDEKIMPALIDAIRGHDIRDPREADTLLNAVPGAPSLPMARASIEMAVWDICARQAGMSLARYCGFRSESAPGGIVIPLMNPKEMREIAGRAVADGYERIKIKIAHSDDIAYISHLRQHYPHIALILDANGAFEEQDFRRIIADIDALGCVCIEEPIARRIGESPADFYARLARLQADMHTPICLDESWVDERELRLALTHEALKCVVIKIGKLGGIAPALRLLDDAHTRGVGVWMGGMFETGISKAVHGALSLHPANIAPGDISGSSRYFMRDICDPVFELDSGYLALDRLGIGFVLNGEFATALRASR